VRTSTDGDIVHISYGFCSLFLTYGATEPAMIQSCHRGTFSWRTCPGLDRVPRRCCCSSYKRTLPHPAAPCCPWRERDNVNLELHCERTTSIAYLLSVRAKTRKDFAAGWSRSNDVIIHDEWKWLTGSYEFREGGDCIHRGKIMTFMIDRLNTGRSIDREIFFYCILWKRFLCALKASFHILL